MKIKWEAILTVTLVACALLTTGVVMRREFFAVATAKPQEDKPSYIEDWRTQLVGGVRMGPSAAPVQVLEFADFECPFCGAFHKRLKDLRERYPSQVALTFVHFPLAMHRFAMPAARVAECAGDQGRFEAMYNRLFEEQESFGLKPWSEYATAAGVPDIAAFDACIKRTDSVPRIEEGKQLGAKLDVQGTPTLVINGWKLGHPPSESELGAMVQAVLAGKAPISAGRKS